MRTFTFLAIPVLASAFHPQTNTLKTTRGGGLKENVIDKYSDEISSQTETILGKVDELVGRRAVAAANHVPMLFTLKSLGDAVGSSKFGIDAAPSAFNLNLPLAGALPSYFNYLWAAAAAAQVASVVKSALAAKNEIDYDSITTHSIANYAATQAISTGNLNWLLLTAFGSSFPNRSGADLKVGVHTLSLQIMSSITTLLAIFAVTSKVCSFVPLLEGKDEIVALLGLGGFYANAKREGNGVVKKTINAAVILGMLWSKISGGGLKITSLATLLSMKTVTLVGTAAIAWVTSKKAKEAIA